jgi:NOL1/NOP2/fmu family ribosome biogenesis protein
VPWSRHGRILEQRPVFTLDPAFHGGAYYVQDSSSMFVGHAFRTMVESMVKPAGRHIRVLDLCAAPGGKSTDLAASLREMFGDDFLLVSNEVMKARVGILADNMALWGDPNVVVTSDDPRAFAALDGFFDVIVADVPCSGEGMFRKDEQAQLQWSEDNVALCEARQRRIVADVWPALAQNGLFVYSTCTFNARENDGNVRWISEELQAEPLLKEDRLAGMYGVFKTEYGYSLVPGFVEGEGQYCSALLKTGTSQPVFASRRSGRTVKLHKVDIPRNVKELFDRNVSQILRGDMLIALPEYLKDDVSLLESFLHVIASGCAVGMVKGKDLVPDSDLALSLMPREGAFQVADVDRDTALAFLHRDAVVFSESPRGYLLLKYEGLPLGFVKNLGNRCNSLHPQSRRIRMNIK